MFADELKNFHLKIGKEEEQWINENVEKLDENQKLNFSRELQNYKEITILALKKVYQEITGKKAKEHIWAICLECGCEYDYGLPMCPACYDKGFDCRARAVKKSEFQPPMKVVRYNKQYQNGDKGETVCYNCVHKSGSFCKNFGNPNWNCHREEFESCNCARCCAVAKRYNAELEKSRSENKISYAMPLKGEK
jgi:hypothetical protein